MDKVKIIRDVRDDLNSLTKDTKQHIKLRQTILKGTKKELRYMLFDFWGDSLKINKLSEKLGYVVDDKELPIEGGE